MVVKSTTLTLHSQHKTKEKRGKLPQAALLFQYIQNLKGYGHK